MCTRLEGRISRCQSYLLHASRAQYLSSVGRVKTCHRAAFTGQLASRQLPKQQLHKDN